MPEGGYKIKNTEGIHFVTFAVVEWIDVFTKKDYHDIPYWRKCSEGSLVT